MNSSAPRLRQDLVVRRQQTARGASYVLKDPLAGDFYRLREAERFVVGQLDGRTPLDVVRERTEARFGAMLRASALSAFIRRLDRAGLLETAAGRRAGRRRRIRGGLLNLRIGLLDPDRLLARIAPRLGFLFTPWFFGLSAALVILAAGVTAGNWDALARDLPRLWQLSAVPLVLAVILAVAFAHELAHGVTCKRLGGEVHEMGAMLIYFFPAFYCDVSDAWLFPERSKRLWVGLSGPWFELFLWALATLAWRLTDAETWVNGLALTAMAVTGAKTLLYFNPLIKLDGYYLLSDWLDLPNLRGRSFRYVGGLLGRLFGGGPRAGEGPPPGVRRIYLTYGLAATVISLGLLIAVAVTAGGFFLDNHQPGALVLLASVVGMRSRRRFRRLFTRPADPSEDEADGDDAGPGSGPAGDSDTGADSGPPDEAESSGSGSPTRRGAASWQARARWAAAAAAALAVLFFGRMELRVAGPFNVLPEENADVRPAVEGIIEAILVDEGDHVKAGAVIARLSNRTLLAELRKTEAEVRETRANLRKLQAGPTRAEIEVGEIGVSKAADRLEYARRRLARLRPLHEQGLLSGREFEDAAELETTARNELAEARGRLTLLHRRSRIEDIDATRARLERLESQQRYLEDQVRRLEVTSPVDGIVATPSRQLKEMERRFVAKGDLIAKVYDLKMVTAQILVPEKEVADIAVGQSVALRARAYPSRVFRGTVTSIATTAQAGTAAGGPPAGAAPATAAAAGPGKTVVVTTRIANEAMPLKPEMTGQAKVYCGKRRIADLIARRLARTFKVEVWSWW